MAKGIDVRVLLRICTAARTLGTASPPRAGPCQYKLLWFFFRSRRCSGSASCTRGTWPEGIRPWRTWSSGGTTASFLSPNIPERCCCFPVMRAPVACQRCESWSSKLCKERSMRKRAPHPTV